MSTLFQLINEMLEKQGHRVQTLRVGIELAAASRQLNWPSNPLAAIQQAAAVTWTSHCLQPCSIRSNPRPYLDQTMGCYYRDRRRHQPLETRQARVWCTKRNAGS